MCNKELKMSNSLYTLFWAYLLLTAQIDIKFRDINGNLNMFDTLAHINMKLWQKYSMEHILLTYMLLTYILLGLYNLELNLEGWAHLFLH